MANTTKQGRLGGGGWAALAFFVGAGGGCYDGQAGGTSAPLNNGWPSEAGHVIMCEPGAPDAGAAPAYPDAGPGSGGGGGGGSSAAVDAHPDGALSSTPPPASCPNVAVARWKELLIVDPTILNDPRADNASTDRSWSFRGRLEALVADPAGAGALANAWLEQWKSLQDVGASSEPTAARLPVTPRPGVDDALRCPWLRSTPDNACDETCGACGARRLDLAAAPFRLLAVANRTDLAAAACGADGGELRLVYSAVAADGITPLPFTVIFEYGIALQAGETLRDWAAAWHRLGALDFGASFAAGFADVLAHGLGRAQLRRVLTNESALGAPDGLPWEMRQFVPMLTDDGVVRLVEVAVAQTPRLTLGPSAALGQWIDENAAAVLAGDNRLDARFISAAAPIPSPDFTWKTAASDATVNAAFNHNTCNGCHGGRSADDLPFQHVAPSTTGGYYGGGMGPVRVSKYLNNPGHDDELGRRERALGALVCGACAGY